MNEINLYNQDLTEFTESDLKALCVLNNIQYNKLEIIDLGMNSLKDLNFIQSNTSFINLRVLGLYQNINLKDITNIKYLVNLTSLNLNDLKIKSINNIKYLNNLKELSISGLNLENEKETIELLKTMSNLKTLECDGTFENYTIKQLKKELPNIKEIFN